MKRGVFRGRHYGPSGRTKAPPMAPDYPQAGPGGHRWPPVDQILGCDTCFVDVNFVDKLLVQVF